MDAPSICTRAHFCVVEAHLVLLLRSDQLRADGEESKVRGQPCQRSEIEPAIAQFVEGFDLGVKVGSVDNGMLQFVRGSAGSGTFSSFTEGKRT